MIEQITNAKKLSNVAEVALIYRSKIKASDRPIIGKSSDAFEIFQANWDPDKIEFIEQFKVL